MSADLFKNAKIVGIDIDTEDYHGDFHQRSGKRGEPDFVMSRSELMVFDRCPSRWLAGAPTTESESTDWGSLMDCLVLSDKFKERYVVKPETYRDAKTGEEKPWNGNSNVCKEWIKDHPGIPLKAEENHLAHQALGHVMLDERMASLIKCSAKQVMVIGEYEDETTGLSVPVKALLDLVPDVKHPQFGKSLADFKTVRNAAQRAFAKQVFEYDWHVQAGFYTDLYVAATGEDRVDWFMAIQENDVPFQTARRLLSVEYVELGQFRYTMALRRYCECLKTGVWPDYETGDNINGWSITAPEAWMVGQ